MTRLKNKKILLVILILILLVVASAFLIEYKLGHQPCKLCIYERIPYIVTIFLIAKIIFINSYEKITLLILFVVFAISTILAFYHFGIEQGFFIESNMCATQHLKENLSKEQLIEQLKQNIISCKDVTYRIFGLSLATINTIFSFILSVIFIKLFLNYGKN